MLRLPLLALLVALVAAISVSAASAAPTPSPSPAHSAAPVLLTAHPVTIDGDVTGVDFKTGIIAVKSGVKKYDIIVTSSTQIQSCKNPSGLDCRTGFMSISDIVTGAKVHVKTSQLGEEYRAQIVTIIR